MATYSTPIAGPHRARIALAGGAWEAQEQVRLRDGTYLATGNAVALETVSAAGADVSLSGTSLVLKSGLAVQTSPHASTVMWRIPVSSLPGLSLTLGRQHSIVVTCDTLPATINAFFGVALATPTGAYDSSAETIASLILGYGNTSVPSVRHAQAAGTYSALAADPAITQGQILFSATSARGDVRAMSGSVIVTESHQAPATTIPTYIYVIGVVQTASLLADATFVNPTIYVIYG